MNRSIPPQAWEAGAGALLLLWRAWTFPVALLWRDWFSVLCAFWIFSALGGRSRAWPYVAGAVMAGLLLLYGAGQLGHYR